MEGVLDAIEKGADVRNGATATAPSAPLPLVLHSHDRTLCRE